MRHERQVELLKRLQGQDRRQPGPLAPASRRQPASAYTDPARFEAERQALFRQHPALVGFSSDLAGAGDFLTAELGGVPVIVLRQPDGALRGFVNACRHRAAPLLAGSGKGLHNIRCGYHAWTYALDGTLKSRPGTGRSFDDVPAAGCALRPVTVAERYGLVFARIAGDAPVDVDRALQGAQVELADYGLGGYLHFETRSREWACNWKLILDTFTEAYHIPFLHKDTIAPYFTHRHMIVDLLGGNPRTIGLRKSVYDEFDKAAEADWCLLPHATIQYFLLPNALVVHQLDHIQVWRVEPLAVDRTRVSTSLYAPQPWTTDKAFARWKKNLDILLDVTESEDFPTMEAIHRNLASGLVPEVIYGQMEPGLINLHGAIERMLQDA
ncbi:MAG: SRPBCC family protein [Sneathiellaceae bacterium]